MDQQGLIILGRLHELMENTRAGNNVVDDDAIIGLKQGQCRAAHIHRDLENIVFIDRLGGRDFHKIIDGDDRVVLALLGKTFS